MKIKLDLEAIAQVEENNHYKLIVELNLDGTRDLTIKDHYGLKQFYIRYKDATDLKALTKMLKPVLKFYDFEV